MTPLTLFVTADPEVPVPPAHYGGIERVVAQLVEGLHARGHSVTLFAHEQSRVSGTLVPWEGRRSEDGRATRRNARQLAAACRGTAPDVIQSFGRLAYLAPMLARRTPKVMSYQRQVTASRVRWAQWLSRGSLRFTGCSEHLIRSVSHIGAWKVIYNSVPIERFRFSERVSAEAPLVFLGRLEEIKGPHLAIEVARRAGRRLVLAGNVPDEHQGFFESQVRPHVDGERVSYRGPVDDAVKSDLLSSAAALLMPILWDEPFGIVMAEALACGTPVIGFRRGAVPEVVSHDVTGAVCETTDEMVDAVGRSHGFDRRLCRADAESRFSSRVLVDAYEALYAEVLSGPTAKVAEPPREARETAG